MALFLTDIDGTLLNPERTLSARTIAAIAAVRDAGHPFVLCSSRMPESMRILERKYEGENEPLIAYNGGLVISASGHIVHDVRLDSADALFIAEHCDQVDLHASFFSGEDWYAWGEDRWTARETNNTGIMPNAHTTREIVASGGVEAAPPHKIMCMGEPELIGDLELKLHGRPGVVTYRSKDTYLEVASARCSKGLGVLAVAAELGTPKHETYFFGDNYNDISAFSAVGTSVAVANAKPEVLAAASETTGRHHDDGVAQYLERWLADH